MRLFTKADYALINLGACIKGQADRLGIEHEGVPLEGVVVRITEAALAARPDLPIGDDEFAPGECTGAGNCDAPQHIHGCFADLGNCEHPEDHPTSDQPIGGRDECRVCGRRVKDFERGGFEDETTGQRGHFVCEGDAPSKWILVYGTGGFVCSQCSEPVRSEPCREHQPFAYALCVSKDLPIGDES